MGVPLSFFRQFHDWELEVVEAFLGNLQKQAVRQDQRIEWFSQSQGVENSKLKITILCQRLVVQRFSSLKLFRTLGSGKSELFYMGSNMGKDIDFGLVEKNRTCQMNRCYICKGKEEPINRMFLHYATTRFLWLLVFLLFGLKQVVHSSIKLILLSWNESYVRKRQKKAWLAAFLFLF